MATIPAKGHIDFGGRDYVLAKAGPVGPTGGVRPAYEEERVRYSAARTSTGEQGYANWPVEEESVWQIGDFKKGFGYKIWGTDSYYYALGVDASEPNELKLAPLVTAGGSLSGESRVFDFFHRTISGTKNLFIAAGRYISYLTDPSTLTVSKDFGTGIYPQSVSTFQGTDATLYTFIALQRSGGMPQPYQVFSGATATTVYSEDTQVTNQAPLAGKYDDNGTFTEDNTAPIALTLNSLVAAQDKVYVSGDQPFAGLTVDINAANSNASVITVKYWNGTSYTAVSGMSDGTASAGASFAVDGAITWTLPTDWVPDNINGTAGYHVQLTWSADFDATVSTTDIDLNQRDTAAFFMVHKALLYRVTKTARGYTLSSTANGGTDATWASVGTIVDLGNPVTGMYVAGGRLFITLQAGLRALSTDGATIKEEVWPHPVEIADTNNGIGASNWRGALWTPLRQGLYRITDRDGFIIIESGVGPQALTGNDSTVRGRVTAVAGDDFNLYAIMQNESDTSYLLKFVPSTEKWHPQANLGAITCRKMWVSDVGHATNALLYFSTGIGFSYIILPRSSANTLHDSACRFAASGTFFPGQFFGGYSREVKAWLAGHTVGERLDTGQTVLYSYRTTDDGTFSDFTAWNTDPGGQESFATSTTSRMIELRLTLTTTDSAKTPVVRLIQTRHAARFPYKRRFRFAVSLEDYQSTRHGLRTESAADLEVAIVNSVSSNAPVVLITPQGVQYDVLPIDSRKFLLHDEEGRNQGWAFFVEAVEHQATVLGTHARLTSFRHDQLVAYTHQQLKDGVAA